MAAAVLLCLLFVSAVSSSVAPSPALASLAGDQTVPEDSVMSQIVAHLETLMRANVREVTSELAIKLDAMSRRLDGMAAVPRPAEAVVGELDLVTRLAALEKSVSAMLKRQESATEAVTDAAKLLADVQRTISNLFQKSEGLQGTISIMSTEQNAVRETVTTVVAKQEDLKQSIALMTAWQSKAQLNFSSIFEKQAEVQQSLSAISTRQKTVQDSISSMSSLHYDTERKLSDFDKVHNTLVSVLANITENQHNAKISPLYSKPGGVIQEPNESANKRQDAIEQSISIILRNQEDLQQTLYSFSENQAGHTFSSGMGSFLEPLLHPSDLRGLEDLGVVTSGEFGGQVLGEPCRGDEDCSSLRFGTVCSGLGRCQCRGGLQEVAGGFCRPHPKLSEPCRNTSDCEGGTEHSLCSNSVCVCSPGLFNFNNTQCRPFPKLSEECIADRDCRVHTEGSVCTNNACACLASLLNYNNRECRPYPELSESCQDDRECQVKSKPAICSGGICACPPTFWNHNNTECRPGVAEGDPCSCENDCTATHSGLSCMDGTCAVRTCPTSRTGSHRFRLYGGSSCDRGFVQFTRNGGRTWVYTCDVDWDERDATAMCRDLGFRRGTPGRGPSGLVPANPPHWEYRRIECSSYATSLLACNWRQEFRQTCPERELPFVVCHAF